MIVYSSGRGYRAARFGNGGGIGCLVLGILGMVALWFILKGLFKLLYWASPVLFALALVINWRAVTDTLKNWLKTMENNPIGGLLMAAVAVLLFPVFALYLFLKALGYNKMQEFQRQFRPDDTLAGDFVEFEELESTPKGTVPPEQVELPEKEPAKKSKTKKQGAKDEQADAVPKPGPDKPENPYDQLFE